MKRVKKSVLAMLLSAAVALAVASSGCVPVALGVGASAGFATAKYLDGAVVSDIARPLPEVWRASKATLFDQGSKNIGGTHGYLDGNLEGETRSGRRLRLKFKRLGPNRTQLTIRVGLVGDVKSAELLLHEIAEKIRAGGGQSSSVPAVGAPAPGAGGKSYVPKGMILGPKGGSPAPRSTNLNQ